MNDLISRQAAIDAICEHGTDLERRGVTVLAVANHKQVTVDLLEQLPSVQPERKKGQWIEVDDAYNRIRGRCSACGWEAHMYEDDVVGMWFCPSCGADMRGEQDE